MKTIREMREANELTQLELAIKLGVTPTTISNWERGAAEPKVTQLRAIARLFGVNSDDIALVERARPAESKIAA